MQRSSAKRRIGNHAPVAAITLGQNSQPGDRSKASLALLIFMRVIAIVWIIEGLVQWHAVTAGSLDDQNAMMNLAMSTRGTIVFFAVIDLVAAVGLWLGSAWGGVIWLVSAGAQLLVALFLPDFYTYRWLTVLADVGLISLYMVLTWQLALASRRPAPGSRVG